MPPPATPDPDGSDQENEKIAVLVIHGVDGDRDQSENHGRLATGLVSVDPDAYSKISDTKVVIKTSVAAVTETKAGETDVDPDAAPRRRGPALAELYEASVTQLTHRDGTQIDVLGITWTDISRFPTKILSFVPALFALLLQMTTYGLEAQRGLNPFGDAANVGPERGRVRSPSHWVPFVGAAALLDAVLLAGVLWSDLGLDVFWLAATGVTVGVLGLGLLLGIRRTNDAMKDAPGTPDPLNVGRVVALSAIEALSWWLAACLIPLTVIVASLTVAFWLAVKADAFGAGIGAVIVGAFVTWLVGRGLVAAGWRYGDGGWALVLDPRTWSLVWVGAVGAILSVQLARDGVGEPVGVANSLLISASLMLRPAWWIAAVLAVVGVLTLLWLYFRDDRSRPAVTTGLASVTMVPALVATLSLLLFAGLGSAAFKDLNDNHWVADLDKVYCLSASDGWSPAACGEPLAAEAERAESRKERLEAPGSAVSGAPLALGCGPRETRDCAVAAIDEEIARVESAEVTQGLHPGGWIRRLFGQVAGPLSVALGIVAGALILGLAVMVATLARKPKGTLVSRLYRCGLGRVGRNFFAIGAGVSLVILSLGWFAPAGGLPDGARSHIPAWLADAGEPSAGLLGWGLVAITGAAIIGKWLKLDPTGGALSGEATGLLGKARDPIDRVYDVATYLRIDDGGGLRDRMVSRVRAAIDAMFENGYSVVVVAAHSQGSVLAAAAILGDDSRQNSMTPRPANRLETIALLSFGSPIRQLYAGFFPGQAYGRWVRPPARPRPESPGSRISFWLNVYRPRDILGRALFVEDPLDPAALEPGVRASRADVPKVSCAIDYCLKGRGGHTNYWDDPRVWNSLDLTIREARARQPGPKATAISRHRPDSTPCPDAAAIDAAIRGKDSG